MSSPLASASAPDADRRTKPRLRGHRRVLTVASVLLALVGGAIADSGTAFAQPPSGTCTQTCNNPPAGITAADWNAALEAADFWANHQIDWMATNWSGGRSYYHLNDDAGRGWPGQRYGNQWFGYWEPSVHRTQFIYYGGVYNDWNGNLSWFEQTAHGGTTSNSYSTYRDRFGITHNAPYVEYDIDYYGAARTQRNARRIIRNPNTGNVFATFDHYQSFEYLGRF